jgi:hypothetical protein
VPPIVTGRMFQRTKGSLAHTRFVALGVALCALVALQGVDAAGAAGGWRRTRKIARGVFYSKIKDTPGPNRIHMLSVDLSRPSTLDVMLARDKLPGFERTTSMARRAQAMAAINGDYAKPSGRPVYTFARDGDLDQTTEQFGRNFSVDTSETVTFIGHPRTSAWMRDPSTGVIGAVDTVNSGRPRFDELALFTPSGGEEEEPPLDACSARLYPSQGPQFRVDGPGVERTYTVDKVICRYRAMNRLGGSVLSTPQFGPRSSEVTSLLPGAQVVLGWSLGWSGVFDTIGGNPTLIEDGQIVSSNVDGSTPFHNRNPRTGVGTTPDGRVLMVAVDGRSPGFSVGMTLRGFARFFQQEGADWALNLDGGGSTTFVVNGDIKNRPSDGPERSVSSALVLLPSSDPGEQVPVRRALPLGRPRPVGDNDWAEVVQDPGSTGGLASFLSQEGVPLGPTMRRAAHKFETTD